MSPAIDQPPILPLFWCDFAITIDIRLEDRRCRLVIMTVGRRYGTVNKIIVLTLDQSSQRPPEDYIFLIVTDRQTDMAMLFIYQVIS